MDALQLNKKLENILGNLRTIMGKRKPHIRTHNVVFAPVGSEAQPWHYDDGKTKSGFHRYFTILIPLNSIDDLCGGTEIWHKKSDKIDMVITCLICDYLNKPENALTDYIFVLFAQIRPRPGDAFVFNGSLYHRGQANSGKVHRLFYYCSFSCVADENIVTS